MDHRLFWHQIPDTPVLCHEENARFMLDPQALYKSTGLFREDLLAGLHRALAAQILSLMERVGIEEDCALAGGGAKDVGPVMSLKEKSGMKLFVPEEPQTAAALGAALYAEKKFSQ
jgi:activator of 2-hydroxyglutaryl-CoA dehydratase